MLDVHPPHSPTHTWRDFFIHIATISVGLLIAVGIEQTVEAIHRAEERRALIEDIRAECENNLKTIAPDIGWYQAQSEWDSVALTALRAAPATGHDIVVALPTAPDLKPPRAPSRAVWAIAKSSGKVALLPENLAEVYDRVDREADQALTAIDRTNAASRELSNLGAVIGTSIESGTNLHLTAVQRDLMMTEVAALRGESASSARWLLAWQGTSQAVLDGITSRTAMDSYLDRVRASLPQR